jgi:hypothetical protein
MFRIAIAAALAGAAIAVAAAPPNRKNRDNFTGRIIDVRGALGTLKLAIGEGKNARVRQFDIGDARIVGLDGDEWKVGDLQEGDEVKVVMTRRGRLVKEVRVLRRPGIPAFSR